jgi:rhodanese-related sulfurtransferase
MYVTLTLIGLLVLCTLLIVFFRRRGEQRRLEEHSITAETLHALLDVHPRPVLLDVRLPLDLLADSEIIPGARRVPPKEILANPALIPSDEDAVIYCTCPSDETSRAILQRALALQFYRVKLLKGGLAAWKAAGYPVERYESSFRLDTA